MSQSAPPAVPAGFSLTSLGFHIQLQSQSEKPVGFPVFGVAGYGTIGQVYEAQAQTYQTEGLAVSEQRRRASTTSSSESTERRYIITTRA